VRRELHEWGQLQMLPSVASHPITRLAPDEQNRQMWQQLPPLIGANKFSKIKPRGQVLAETEDGVELLVAGEYGAGRVLALAANSTVRWWRFGHELEHKRFWRQVVLWLVHRDAVEQHDVWVKLDQRRFHTGSRVVFTAGAKTPQGDVVHNAEFQVRITGPRGAKIEAAVSQDQDQIVGAAEQVQEVGDYRIDITALLDGNPLGTAQAEFVVFDQDIELSNPAPDHLQLTRLANMTRAAGGRAVAPEQLPELLEQIRQQPPEMEFEVPTKWQPGDTAADAWLGFLLIVGLLSGEWILRKRWGLV
jgi:hypothetical protein